MTQSSMNSGLTQIPLHTTLANFLEERAVERNQKKKHILYTLFPDIREINTRVYWGVFSWAIPKWKQRWLLKRTALSYGGMSSSPGDVVRDYLDYYHPTKLRCIGSEARTYERSVSAPLLASRSIIHEATYIDIISTYFSIVKLVGWNVGYLPELWVIPGRAPLNFPLPENKAARNYLVSIGLPRPMTVWNGYRMVSERGTNAHINRSLWHLTMDILHSIANIAVRLGATYVHTDGYILPSRAAPILMSEIESWGLKARVLSEGDAYVFGIGNYQVGHKRSMSFNPSVEAKQINTIRSVNHKWIKSRVVEIVTKDVTKQVYDRWPIE